MSSDADLLQQSLKLVASRGADLVDAFYQRLFAAAPGVRRLFPADMSAQRDKLLAAIIALVGNYHQRDELVPGLQDLGRRHVRYGAQPEHYPVVGEVLLATLRDTAGQAWTDEHEQAWTRAYTFAAEVMQQAAAEAPAAQATP